MQTGKIGLKAFLFYRKVPGQDSPICPYGAGPQTAEHLFANCTALQSQGLKDMGFSSVEEVRAGLSNPHVASKMTKNLLLSGWLQEFQLSEQLRLQGGLVEALKGWQRKPPPERHKRRPRRLPTL